MFPRPANEKARSDVATDALRPSRCDHAASGAYRGGTGSRAVVCVAALALVGGCGDEDLERTPYVEKNLALLQAVPAYPSSKRVRFVSSPYRENDTPDARVAGYGTTRVDAISSATPPAAVIAFYRRTLARDGWRVVDLSKAPSISLRRRDAYLHILAGRGEVDVEADHNCYKGRSSPSCFGP